MVSNIRLNDPAEEADTRYLPLTIMEGTPVIFALRANRNACFILTSVSFES